METRPEIAGRRSGTSAGTVGPDAYSVPDFCARHGISEAFYYKLRAKGLGPAEMRLGRAVRITKEAAATWRTARTTTTEV